MIFVFNFLSQIKNHWCKNLQLLFFFFQMACTRGLNSTKRKFKFHAYNLYLWLAYYVNALFHDKKTFSQKAWLYCKIISYTYVKHLFSFSTHQMSEIYFMYLKYIENGYIVVPHLNWSLGKAIETLGKYQ